MDKIFSTRIDESIIQRISYLARRLNTSKKQVIERAILSFAKNLDNDTGTDIFKQTFGSWKRRESAEQTVKKSRKAFNESMRRNRD